MKRLGIALILGFVCATPAASSSLDDGGCVFDRRIYPDGYEMCQSGKLKRCDNGAWEDLGHCDDETMPPPIDGGGDVVVEPEG